MRKPDLIDSVKLDAGITRSQAGRAIKSVIAAIRTTLAGDGMISFSGLGRFKVKERKARPGRNPATGAAMELRAGKRVSFKPSLSLKRLISPKGG